MEVSKKLKTEDCPERIEKERVHYDELKRENALFSLYYSLQEIVPQEEFPSLLSFLGRSLPLTFRLTGHRSDAKVIKQKLESELLPALGAGAKILEWYSPKGYAFQLDTDRKTMRTNEDYKLFHKWLVAATENGDISRQEAVSMIPPLFLDVQSDHMVLDMCAAPGSKTAQLIEGLHADSTEPSGMVIANDSDKQRAFMLYHQVKRILSPCLLVTNNDGTLFPTLIGQKDNEEPKQLLFDRILADVPCSGDGTLRKNAMLWGTWTPNHALGLHPLQIRLLDKAVKLLKVGGRVVYSTCSMNFVENEAVVAHILDRYPHALELVDVSDLAPQLIRCPGRDHWKVISKEGTVFMTPESVPENQRKRFPPSLFPKDSYKSLNLDRCVRIYPHLQNTGGFFIAVIHKKEELSIRKESEIVNDEGESAEVKPKGRIFNKGYQYRRGMKPEDELRYLDVKSDPTLLQIFDWYGIDVTAMMNAGYGFLVRSERDPIRVITIVSAKLAPIMKATLVAHRKGQEEEQNLFNGSMKIVNAGVRAFELYESSRPIPVQCAYRPLAESIDVLRPFFTKRIMQVSIEDITALLNSQNSIDMQKVSELGEGGAVLETETDSGVMAIPVWISERGVKAFVPSANRPAMLLKLESMKNEKN